MSDDVRDLIAEARGEAETVYEIVPDMGDIQRKGAEIVADLFTRLADALEATLQPVDVDALADVIGKLQFRGRECFEDIACEESIRDHAEEIARAVVEWIEKQN